MERVEEDAEMRRYENVEDSSIQNSNSIPLRDYQSALSSVSTPTDNHLIALSNLPNKTIATVFE
jgi:hypothetical protein